MEQRKKVTVLQKRSKAEISRELSGYNSNLSNQAQKGNPRPDYEVYPGE